LALQRPEKRASFHINSGELSCNSTTAVQAADQPDRNAKATMAAADDQDWVAEAQQRANEGDTETTASVNASPGRTVSMSVDEIENMGVYNAKGRKLGDVERVVLDQSSNKTFLVLAHGGFLGMFEDEVAIPMNRIRAGDNRLYIRGLTSAEVSQMPDWENRIPNYRELDGNQQAKIQAWK
jgi:sporulation protein YlmC with PRC-barrel domain